MTGSLHGSLFSHPQNKHGVTLGHIVLDGYLKEWSRAIRLSIFQLALFELRTVDAIAQMSGLVRNQTNAIGTLNSSQPAVAPEWPE